MLSQVSRWSSDVLVHDWLFLCHCAVITGPHVDAYTNISTSYEAPRPVSQGELKQRTSTSSSISRYSYLSSDSSLSRRSSVSTLTSISSGPIDFDKVPQLISIKTQWEAQQQLPRRSSTLARSRPLIVFPAHIFKTLPREIYDCILDHLKLLHFEDNESCPQCYLRDLCNISLTSRAWDQAATLQLYAGTPIPLHIGHR